MCARGTEENMPPEERTACDVQRRRRHRQWRTTSSWSGRRTAMTMAVLALLVFLASSTAGSTLSLPEAKSILDRWRPEVHGAVAVKVGEIPYQASIRLYSPEANMHKCGGAIISPWHILTAAHCVPYATTLAPESVFVVVGAVKRSSLDRGDLDIAVRKTAHISRHPDFSSRDQRNDLALLTLNKVLPTDKKDRIAPVPLPVGDIRVDIGTTCSVSGWGNNTAQTLVDSDALLSAEVPFIGRDLCAKMYEPVNLAPGVICTAHQTGGAGACVGDTGSPLVCNGFLAGTVSWGSGCGPNAKPTVYTSVADHVEWIREQMAVTPRGGQRASNAVLYPQAGGGSGAASLSLSVVASLLALMLMCVGRAGTSLW